MNSEPWSRREALSGKGSMNRYGPLFWLMLAVIAGVHSVLLHGISGVGDRAERERASTGFRELPAAATDHGNSLVDDETADAQEGLYSRDYDVTDLVGGPPGNLVPSLD